MLRSEALLSELDEVWMREWPARYMIREITVLGRLRPPRRLNSEVACRILSWSITVKDNDAWRVLFTFLSWLPGNSFGSQCQRMLLFQPL